jgi:hypothetical protein
MRLAISRDMALLVVVVPLWAVCFSLHLKELASGPLGWVPVIVASSPDRSGHPIVSGFWPGVEADPGGVRTGDRVLRVGETDLAGAGPFFFVAATYAYGGSPIPVDVSRDGQLESVRFALRPVGASWRLPLLSLGFALPGFLVLWRRSGSRAARAAFLASVCFSFQWTFFFGGPPIQTYLWVVVFGLSALGLYPLMVQAVLAMPEESPASSSAPVWTWALSLYAVGAFSWVFGFPFSSQAGVRLSAVLNALAPLVVLGLITRSYVRSGPIGRRQLRWIVYGFYLGAVPVALGSFLPAASPGWWWLHEVLMSSVVLFPLCFFIAIVRFNFLDIDRLITVTLSYSVVLALVVLLGAAGTPMVGEAAASATGIPTYVADSALFALLAAAMIPAHRRLRPRIDRALFAERYAVEQGIDELIEELAACDDPAELHKLAGQTLDRLLRPESCVTYARAGRGLVPRFVASGDTVASLEDGDPLVEFLREHRSAISLEGAGRRLDGEQQIRRAMGSVHAAVVIALRRGDDAVDGLLCLGCKRSGDVYTTTDLALLTRVAETISVRLAH